MLARLFTLIRLLILHSQINLVFYTTALYWIPIARGQSIVKLTQRCFYDRVYSLQSSFLVHWNKLEKQVDQTLKHGTLCSYY